MTAEPPDKQAAGYVNDITRYRCCYTDNVLAKKQRTDRAGRFTADCGCMLNAMQRSSAMPRRPAAVRQSIDDRLKCTAGVSYRLSWKRRLPEVPDSGNA